MADTYPNGEPPNLRIVECCNTCKHVEYHYEGERSCKKYPVRPEWYDEDDPSSPIHVEQNNICDGYEPSVRAALPADAGKGTTP
jgi:hypothetical protein